MCPGCLPPAFAEMHGGVIRVAGQKARERKRRVMPRPPLHASIFHPPYLLARHLIRPRPRLAVWFIRSVKLEHDLVLGSRAQKRLVLVNNLLRFVIEAIYLCTDHANAVEPLEEHAAFVIGF